MTQVRMPSLATAAIVVGWLLAGSLAAVAVARAVDADGRSIQIGIQGIAVWLLIPAYPLLVGAVIAVVRRRRRGTAGLRWCVALASVALVLVGVQVLLLVSAIGWNGTRSAPVGSGALRIVSANVLLDNTQVPDLARELVATGADVIVLQEVTPEHVTALNASPLAAAYPHRLLDPLPGYHGSAIFSRFAIAGGGPIDVAGSPMLQADIHLPGGLIRLINVHTVAPIGAGNAAAWREQFAELSRMAGTETSPLILAGDFNATLDHAPLRRLLAEGLRDAFVEGGTGFGATWPRWDGIVPPVMRLDHVLVSSEISVVSLATQTSSGSDHRRLLVDLALPPAS
ncbi:endonuclease/exonuclease/phosphatase family protein [Cryobacterium cryoconiti]|uniref:Endonuclease/exonuclease/phosphatase domain-containing protein n=1 Tax=Cryobacterium cryoconiti TaxID=1259239 RepID=A0A4Y8JV88_9MICO|nr:endonuclease/exonuclease/phosphatase family protein [Cryobacterium cryoconiti]TFD30671.1 hypothetical protein E3T49_07370 [Cryobacterium cryoconiti]